TSVLRCTRVRTVKLLILNMQNQTMYDSCYKCEDGWKGKCYYFSTRKSSWDQSKTECSTKGGGLVKIDSSEEQVLNTAAGSCSHPHVSFLGKNVQQKTTGYDDLFWIGLTGSAEEGKWLWVDGSPLNESGEDPDGDDCVGMGPMYWFDNSCKVPQRSICEKPALILCG
uniref:C-type lectin domain-containing protein n=1 Tax=Maylandia zebra TaxID=106582 RepID=A0A3P9BQ28_9CICH